MRNQPNTHQLYDLQVSGYGEQKVLVVELDPAERSARRRMGAGRFRGGGGRLHRRRCDRSIDGDNGFVHHGCGLGRNRRRRAIVSPTKTTIRVQMKCAPGRNYLAQKSRRFTLRVAFRVETTDGCSGATCDVSGGGK